MLGVSLVLLFMEFVLGNGFTLSGVLYLYIPLQTEVEAATSMLAEDSTNSEESLQMIRSRYAATDIGIVTKSM